MVMRHIATHLKVLGLQQKDKFYIIYLMNIMYLMNRTEQCLESCNGSQSVLFRCCRLSQQVKRYYVS